MYNVCNKMGKGVWHMSECPFLTTYENEVECFKECALYEWKENGGVCPFKNINEYKLQKLGDFEGLSLVEREIAYIKDSYLERQEDYIKL